MSLDWNFRPTYKIAQVSSTQMNSPIGRNFIQRRSLLWAPLLAASHWNTGCSESELHRSEREFLLDYKDFKNQTLTRDSSAQRIAAISSALVSAYSEQRQNSARREYHELSKDGSAGPREGLALAKKMLENPAYESELRARTRENAVEIERLKGQKLELEASMPTEIAKARKLLPAISESMARFETAVKTHNLSTNPQLKASAAVSKAMVDIKAQLDDEITKQRREDSEKTRKKVPSNSR